MKKFLTGLLTGAMVLATAILPFVNCEVSAASGYKVSGYVNPNVTSANGSIKKDFKVEIVEIAKSVLTDANGYFEILDVPGSQSGYTVEISKNTYLTRQINNVAVTGTVIFGSSGSPVEIWAGDTAQDNAINLTDIMQIANSFNTVSGNAKYVAASDINMNNAVNMEDIMIVVANFNKTPDNYSTITPTVIPSNITSPTPVPSLNPSDAWELNTGTINLGPSVTYTGTGISVSGSTVRITAGGDHTVTGTLSNGMILINTSEKVKLRLTNASITNQTGPAIYCQNADKMFITLDKGTTNTLVDGNTYSDQTAKGTISSNDDLEIKGGGTLNITGNFNHAISCDDDINIENGIINIKSAKADGIHANNSIDITGGTLNITATSDCIQTETEGLTIDDGSLTLSSGSQGLTSDTSITINGGNVNIAKSKEGIESPNITVSGGTLSVTSTDDCLNATKGTGSVQDDGSMITISGGSIYLNGTTGDPLDSNGSVIVNGGTTIIHGPQSMPEVGADVNGKFTVSGGTFFVCGPNAMMAQYPTGASAQYTIAAMFASQPANSALCVKDSTGKALFITRPKRNYIYAVFSSPELRQGSTYTIYSGGNVSGGSEVNGLITGGTYNGGTAVATITVNTSPTTTYNWSGGGFPGGGWPGGGWPR